MKKRLGKDRAVPEVDYKSLTAMPTKKLLGRLKRLQYCENSAIGSDMSEREIAEAEGILFKDTEEWQRTYEELKTVLSSREHIPRGAERRKARQERAVQNSTVERRSRRRT